MYTTVSFRPLSSLFLAIAIIASVSFVCPSDSCSDVVFHFNYTDDATGQGVGFNDATEGANRRQGLENAAAYVSSFFVNYSANINIDVNGSQTNDTTLASAASHFNAPFSSNGFNSRGDVMTKILGGDGADPSSGVADGIVDWNFEDFQWEPLSDFQAGELDLFSTAVHELLHAVGFASDIRQNGNSGFGDTPGNPSSWSPFDQFVADSSGSIISGTTFALDGARWSSASVGGAGDAGLLFNGANAMAANGGNAVALYSPTTWLSGSSGSHLDTDFFTGEDGTTLQMMNHEAAVDFGLDVRVLSAIEVGILKDIGYANIAAIPEPGSFIMVLAGCSTLFVARRRKRI